MPRPNPNNIPRPERVIHEKIRVGVKKNVKEALKELPAEYLEKQRGNKKIKACCQDVNNLSYETFKTDEFQENANLAVFECSVCGCRHYRVAHGSGKAG